MAKQEAKALVIGGEQETITGYLGEPIVPIEEREPYIVGDATPVKELMERLETLENRVNLIIGAVSKSKSVKGI